MPSKVYDSLLPTLLKEDNADHSADYHQLYAEPSTVRWMRDNLPIDECIIVSPDAGGAKRYDSTHLALLAIG